MFWGKGEGQGGGTSDEVSARNCFTLALFDPSGHRIAEPRLLLLLLLIPPPPPCRLHARAS